MRASLASFPALRWTIFAGREEKLAIRDPRVNWVFDFPANNRMARRLIADHFSVPQAAAAAGAEALLTVGFAPLRDAGLPVVMHAFTLHHRRGMGPGALYRRWAMARGLRRARLVITNSQWTRRGLGPTRAPVIVSPEGLDHDRFRPDGPAGAEAVPALPPEYLLWTGNFYRYKRADRVLAAYARLPAELRRRYPFVFVGGDWNGGRAAAEAEARRLGMGDSVRFTGWVDEAHLPALYRGARAMVMASEEETFGKSVTEAMACGCPCVLNDIEVLREVSAGAAVQVDFANATAAGSALQGVIADEARHAQLRAAGLVRAADFGFDRLARERIAAIASALGRTAELAADER